MGPIIRCESGVCLRWVLCDYAQAGLFLEICDPVVGFFGAHEHSSAMRLAVVHGGDKFDDGSAIGAVASSEDGADVWPFLAEPLLQGGIVDRRLFPERGFVDREFAETLFDELAVEEGKKVTRFGAVLAVQENAIDRLERGRLVDRGEARRVEDADLKRVAFPWGAGQFFGQGLQESPLRLAEFLRARGQSLLQPGLFFFAGVVLHPVSRSANSQ